MTVTAATAAARVFLCTLSLLGAVALLPNPARAGESCPDVPADDASARRAMAKEQFARAEQAEAEGDRQTAVKRYACSLKLVPHPSTAYNLGTTAEKVGDLSMAVEAFKMYLTLAPDANDRAAVESRVARLEARLADLRSQMPVAPPDNVGATGQPGTGPTGPAAGTSVAPPPVLPPERGPAHRVAGVATLGGAVAALGTGIAFNLVARAKMRDCRALYPSNQSQALDQCDAAKPFAYGSYGLFALSGALGVASLTLLLWHTESAPSSPSITWAPGPGGGSLIAIGRF
jgi:hypothetical protein